MSINVILLLTVVPDKNIANKLASNALSMRLAACVTQLPAAYSTYHWQGKILSTTETQLLFKTSIARSLELAQFIQNNHPHKTPEILSWQVMATAAYGQWIIAETQYPIDV